MSLAACKMSFGEWLDHCFGEHLDVVQVSNSQTRILAAVFHQSLAARRTDDFMEYDIHQALRNLNSVELLARTEHFSQDVSRFPSLLKGHGVDFKYREIKPQNITSHDYALPVEERIRKMEGVISRDWVQRLMRANAQDLALYEYANKRLGSK